MKKSLLALIILVLAIMPLISAQSIPIDLGEGMRQIIDQIINFATPVFEIILGSYSGSEYFFEKVMVLMLLSGIISIILGKIPSFEGYRNITIIIGIIISALAVRFISESQMFYGMLLPYGVVGIALTAILPFLIFVYFIHSIGMSGLGRKISWIFFSVIFIIIWIYKADQIGDIGNTIYIIMILIMIIMLIFDRRIAAYFRGESIREWERNATTAEIANLQAEYNNIRNVHSQEGDRRKKEILKRLRKLGARNP